MLLASLAIEEGWIVAPDGRLRGTVLAPVRIEEKDSVDRPVAPDWKVLTVLLTILIIDEGELMEVGVAKQFALLAAHSAKLGALPWLMADWMH